MRPEEIGVMFPRTREHLEPPEPGRGREVFFSRAFRGCVAPWAPWFQTFDLQNCEEISFCCSELMAICCSSPGNLIQGGRKTNKQELQILKMSLIFYVIYKMRDSKWSQWSLLGQNVHESTKVLRQGIICWVLKEGKKSKGDSERAFGCVTSRLPSHRAGWCTHW